MLSEVVSAASSISATSASSSMCGVCVCTCPGMTGMGPVGSVLCVFWSVGGSAYCGRSRRWAFVHCASGVSESNMHGGEQNWVYSSFRALTCAILVSGSCLRRSFGEMRCFPSGLVRWSRASGPNTSHSGARVAMLAGVSMPMSMPLSCSMPWSRSSRRLLAVSIS
jgi:hypothetical protein